MARSNAFQSLARIIRVARFCDRHGLSTNEGLECAAALEAAGEHTSSFYEYQGFMEGGALSGLRAAAEVLQAL